MLEEMRDVFGTFKYDGRGNKMHFQLIYLATHIINIHCNRRKSSMTVQ